PYYASTRDLREIPGGELVLYTDWSEARAEAHRHLADADVAMVTSYCPHGIAAAELVAGTDRPLRIFYDLDPPVTLSRLRRGEPTSYIGPRGLRDFDLALSFTGGAALEALQSHLGAPRALPLYGHADPMIHRPDVPAARFAADLSYIGTYAEDRQQALERLLV